MPTQIIQSLEELKEATQALRELHERLAIAAIGSDDQTVRRRTDRVELVLRAAIMMLRADPNSTEVHEVEKYIANNINSGISEFGLKVIKE